MKIRDGIGLDFDDVLIIPKRSNIQSRAQVDLNRKYKFNNFDNYVDVGIPIIAANMDTVGTFAMAKALARHNIWTALHKFYTVEQLYKFFTEEVEVCKKVFFSIGITDNDLQKAKMLTDMGVELKNICIDVANGYTQQFVERCSLVRELYPNAIILAGNVCTGEMVQELLLNGKVSIVKVGIGGGAVCTTRHTTGIGYPQLSAVIECADTAHGLGGHICSDGGCRMPSHIVKSMAAGADWTMIGGMFSGHDECEGEFEYDEQGNKKSMLFYGMSSKTAMEKHYGGKASYRPSEGRAIKVPYKGKIDDTVEQVLGGLRSACTYVGTTNLKDLSKCTTFIRTNRVHDNMTSF